MRRDGGFERLIQQSSDVPISKPRRECGSGRVGSFEWPHSLGRDRPWRQNGPELNPRLTPISNARAYELRYAHVPEEVPPGPWQSGGLYSATRTPLVSGLTPGVVYQFQARAIGGSTGASDWSSTVSQRTL